ncbi:hypothetical protein ISS07_03205 [Candidatus Woesearchaeota archaeon]|nr:hypothetical protein [Candidatus Woesearchaeota archaeon]
MRIRVKKKNLEHVFRLLFFLVVLFMLFVGTSLTSETVFGGNDTNRTVSTKVNVSNSPPSLDQVVIESPLDSLGNIDLEAGNATTVICNGTFWDPNNFDDIISVNATLYRSISDLGEKDDNNTFYSNTSCLQSGQTCEQNSDIRNGSCNCQFAVQYYAEPGNWQCNMTISDGDGLSDINNSPDTFLNEILGIDVGTLIIDYGNLSVTEISRPIIQNLTNIGNVPLNITVRGYGGDNETTGQNVSMVCDPSVAVSNISFNSQRFTVYNDTPFANMINLTNQTRQIGNLTIPKRINNTWLANSSNATFWRLQIPIGAGGLCNGTIIFGAVDATDN